MTQRRGKDETRDRQSGKGPSEEDSFEEVIVIDDSLPLNEEILFELILEKNRVQEGGTAASEGGEPAFPRIPTVYPKILEDL